MLQSSLKQKGKEESPITKQIAILQTIMTQEDTETIFCTTQSIRFPLKLETTTLMLQILTVLMKVSSSIQNLNESPEEDKKESNKMTADTNITLNITEDKIKGRKPVPVPRKTKPYAGNFNKVQQPRMQETSNFRKDTLAKKQPTRLAVTSNKNRTLSLNSDDDSNFSLSNEKQFEPSHDNYRNHVLNEFAATSAYNAVKRNKEDVLLMYPYKGSENPVKYPGSISNYLQTYIEQDTKQHKPRTHIIKPFSINIEVACESNKIPQQGDELTESEQFSENADSSQFDDYMNI
ncbi:hypothetical protein KUTeg_006310 [Tegillarca granosa]|uniref:Uncharacterized protein n=1 Tax=Tegillarca granosa TaxID=220873 RepID=A0ABQ9FG49_TEGGR|nr:hypothetical protein KUTeg_006310 [Tegillarca granosa]